MHYIQTLLHCVTIPPTTHWSHFPFLPFVNPFSEMRLDNYHLLSPLPLFKILLNLCIRSFFYRDKCNISLIFPKFLNHTPLFPCDIFLTNTSRAPTDIRKFRENGVNTYIRYEDRYIGFWKTIKQI